jgi:hypothetical protein
MGQPVGPSFGESKCVTILQPRQRSNVQSKERHLRDTHTTRAAPAGIDLLAGSHVLCIVLLLLRQPY